MEPSFFENVSVKCWMVLLACVVVIFGADTASSAVSAASTRINSTTSAAAAPSNVQEDAVPFGGQFFGGSAFNNPFGGVSANPAFNFRARSDLLSAGLPYAQPNCLGHQPGMYGSPTYSCQVFFVCQADGRLDPLPCPQGTRFNNYLGVCDWPQKVDANCNPIYSENYERYGALASLYGGDPLGGGQFARTAEYFPSNVYGGGVGFGGSPLVNPRFQSQALRFPQPAFRSLRTSASAAKE